MIVVTETKTQYWKHFQARALEWLNAAMLFGWGCYVVLHPGLFTDPRTDDLWKGMLAVASEPVWGMMTLIVGLLRLAALYINGRHKRTPMVRLVASFFSAFIFTQIALGIYNSGVSNPGVLVYPVLVLADIYSAFRASSDMTFVARQDEKPPVAESGRVVDFAQRS